MKFVFDWFIDFEQIQFDKLNIFQFSLLFLRLSTDIFRMASMQSSNNFSQCCASSISKVSKQMFSWAKDWLPPSTGRWIKLINRTTTRSFVYVLTNCTDFPVNITVYINAEPCQSILETICFGMQSHITEHFNKISSLSGPLAYLKFTLNIFRGFWWGLIKASQHPFVLFPSSIFALMWWWCWKHLSSIALGKPETSNHRFWNSRISIHPWYWAVNHLRTVATDSHSQAHTFPGEQNNRDGFRLFSWLRHGLIRIQKSSRHQTLFLYIGNASSNLTIECGQCSKSPCLWHDCKNWKNAKSEWMPNTKIIQCNGLLQPCSNSNCFLARSWKQNIESAETPIPEIVSRNSWSNRKLRSQPNWRQYHKLWYRNSTALFRRRIGRAIARHR